MIPSSETPCPALSDTGEGFKKESALWRYRRPVLVLLNLVLVYFAVSARRHLLADEARIVAVEADFRGIALQAALVILTLGITVSYLLLRSFEVVVRRMLKPRVGFQHHLLTVDVTTTILMSSAAFLPVESYSLAKAAPWPLLLMSLVIGFATTAPRPSSWRSALVPLATSMSFMLLELALLGRWGA